ncbi:tRNA-uridine aminocarboxypropyltransferase [Vibrio fortis]|uniref:tRNA-uridine aminocarboxypropyltransferase n=1 Tax=Vibrio fortis TaxID=212667 RepID=UPI0021C26B2A|nr:DTW domain-containing protein [Vibrio fortis]
MEKVVACQRCGFTHQCICSLIPTLESSVNIALLTHENELQRDTNTGKLLQQTLPNCRSYVWQRKSAPTDLMAMINDDAIQALLLFPSEQSVEVSEVTKDYPVESHKLLFIVLDATWQEAKKMMNKSPWLKDIPQVHLTPNLDSAYTLRRNQDSGHLCTCEVGSLLLSQLGETEQAQQLNQYFQHYLKVFQADKSGHALR